MCVFDPGF